MKHKKTLPRELGFLFFQCIVEVGIGGFLLMPDSWFCACFRGGEGGCEIGGENSLSRHRVTARNRRMSGCERGRRESGVGAVTVTFYSLNLSPAASTVLLVLGLELVREGELGSLFLQLGKLVLVFGDLLESGLDEFSLHVRDGHVELVDLEVPEDDFPLEEEHFALQVVPLVEVVLDDLLQLVLAGVLDVLLGSAALADDALALRGLPLLFLLQLLGSLLPEQSPQLLLALGSHETLLLGHLVGVCVLRSESNEQQRPVVGLTPQVSC